tara:strand:- start:44 stop:916 length:873 start_codon:yes stop_codon:yes gene_type:complete
MKIAVFIFFIFSFLFPIGTDAFNYPISAESYGLSSGLTAWPYNYSQNPAVLTFINNQEISFSHNSWLGDMDGQNLGIILGKKRKNSLEITKWTIDNFELRNEVPSEEPLGEFGATFLSATLSSSVDVGSAKSIGLGYTQYIYSLYDRNVYGSNIDIGFYMKLNEINFGIAVNNIGIINNKKEVHSPAISLGSMYHVNKINSDIIVDFNALINESNNQRRALLTFGAVKYFGYGKIFFSKVFNVWYENEYVTDFSLGAEISLDKWKLLYGYQINSSSVLGNPQSIQIVYTF